MNDDELIKVSHLFLENRVFIRGVRESENIEILEFIGILERVGIRKGIGSTPSTISQIRAIPSVISFGLTIFRVSFCTRDKFYIDSVSFLVHVLMFGCIYFKWHNKPVVFAYLVLNSW